MGSYTFQHLRFHAEKIDHFQVFGERRTGTNYVARLISDNLEIKETTKYGWKHSYPTMPCIARSALIVVVVRSPLAWLSSLHNRPFAKSHEGLSFPDFLRTQWYDQYRARDFGHGRWGYEGMPKDRLVANQLDRHPITGARFANPLELRTVKNQCFLGLTSRESNCVIVDYDVANDTPVDTVRAIAALFDVSIREHVEVPGHVGAKGHQKPRVTAKDMSAQDLAFIRDNLDFNLEARLGFGDDLSV
jgi:hypothetical protein